MALHVTAIYIHNEVSLRSQKHLPISPTCINNAVIVTPRKNEHEVLAIWHTRKRLIRSGLQQPTLFPRNTSSSRL